MKAQGGVEIERHELLTSALHVHEWLIQRFDLLTLEKTEGKTKGRADFKGTVLFRKQNSIMGLSVNWLLMWLL